MTPPANELILHGVMRDSTIQLIKQKNRMKFTERMIHIDEVTEAIEQNRMKEIFTTGTAVTIGSVESFNLNGKQYKIDIDPELKFGKFTYEIYKEITDIQYGRKEHEWSVVFD